MTTQQGHASDLTGLIEGVDVDTAKEALELTAETVLEQARWLGR